MDLHSSNDLISQFCLQPLPVSDTICLLVSVFRPFTLHVIINVWISVQHFIIRCLSVLSAFYSSVSPFLPSCVLFQYFYYSLVISLLRFFFFKVNLFIYGCVGSSLLRVSFLQLWRAGTSLVVEHGLQVCGLQQLWHMGSVVVAHGLQSTGSVVVAHGLSCSVACGIFLDQGSNPCPLHWQADS